MYRLAHAMCVALVSCLVFVFAGAQTRTSETTAGTGSISGRITSGGKPLTGLGVALQPVQLNGPSPSRQSTVRSQTDADGRYQFTGIAAGNYQIVSFSPLYVQEGDSRSAMSGKQITLNDGEQAVDVNLALIRGGVVTGKLTDPDGRPLIEQYVQLDRLDAQSNAFPVFGLMGGMLQTDDRGIYRAIGVPPGRYRVSAGQGEGSTMRVFNRRAYPRTFHPDVQDAKQATIIEVREGNEVTGVDIKLGLLPKVYIVSGRAVDADTGEPVANLSITCSAMPSDGRMGMMIGRNISGATGEFRLENVGNGRYGIMAGGDSGLATNSPGYSDMVPIEVQDGDVSGIEIRVKRGGSISGIAVLEGTSDSTLLSRLSQQRLFVFIRNEGAVPSSPISQQIKVGPDGRFRLDGLRPGKVMFNHVAEPGSSGINLIKIERDGVTQPSGIEMGPGEQVMGVRIVFAYGNAIVRGQVLVTGGTLPEGVMFFIMPRRTDIPRQEYVSRPSRTDARGFFVLEGLAPGQYELEAIVGFMGPPPPEWGRRPRSVKQTVEVTNGQVAQVTMTLDLSQPPPDRER